MSNQEDIAIKVEGVYKDFDLPHEAQNSLKTRILHPMSKGKNIERQHALKDISFEIKKGEFFGIVGRNGSGKSTLLKILAEIYTPTKGKVTVNGSLTPFIELGVGFNPELTGRENVYLNGAMLGFSTKEMERMYDEIVDFAELDKFMDQKLKNYSSGMQVRLAFSVAIRAKSDILLLDEVLAVGDADFQRKCYQHLKELKKRKQTVVFVSHDMSAVREYCDRVVLIESSKIDSVGDSSTIARRYSELFLNHNHSDRSQQSERWGNGSIKVEKVKCRVSNNSINVFVIAKTTSSINDLIYGIHVLDGSGKEVTAMNNKMINMPNIKKIEANKIIEFEWKMLNIFSDGEYSVTLTMINELGETLDWYTNASSFTVKRIERSTTAVLPPVSVKYNL